jgi:hypothetical protein
MKYVRSAQEHACTLLPGLDFNIVSCFSFSLHNIFLSYFILNSSLVFNINCFIPLYVPDLKAMGNHKRKSNRELKCTQELLDVIKRRKEDGKSGRQIALSLGIAEKIRSHKLCSLI